jgi:DNA-binding MarR family transcriptional regulator
MVWLHIFPGSTKALTLTPCLLPQFRIPKYDRLKRLAERYGVQGLDPSSMATYLLLSSLAAEVREIANAKLARHGLGEGRITVLVLLLESQPEPLSHSRLAGLLGVTKGSITGLVDGLEHDGLVKRCETPGDRRTRLIELTPAGIDVVNRYLPQKCRGIDRLMSSLTPAERETLLSLLLKVQDGLPAYRAE